ncbi:alanine racemase [Aestuariimicrobium soli]|uniref:alanine racemase n=1 Tax=Aestuariimicrobium soli TaxID=2035834 RepID=UPI003EB70DC4
MPATIDLSALHHNLGIARDRAPGAAVLVAVKANAYGHGAVAVARALQSWSDEHPDDPYRLGVALVREGQQLREAGITLPILKLSHCTASEVDDAVAAGLTLTVVDEATIMQAEGAAARAGVRVPVHLKLDSGMGRIGSPLAAAVELAQAVDAAPHLELEGVFTHLPSADQPSSDAFTAEELDRFGAAVDHLVAARGEVRFVHASNSAAVLRHHRDRFTLVRPGIMAYGYSPDPSTMPEPELRPVLSWTTELTFVKHVTAGTTIGYGRTWTAPRGTWIGTIAVGYGDGWSRLNGNRGHVLVGGRRVPVVGRVCMDQSMIDLGVEPPGVAVGDEVVLIGRSGDESLTADDLADLMGTISYEVLCLVGSRVPRVVLG